MADSHFSVVSGKLLPIWQDAIDQLETDKENKELLAVSQRLGDIVERLQECRGIVVDLTLLSRPEINSVFLKRLERTKQ